MKEQARLITAEDVVRRYNLDNLKVDRQRLNVLGDTLVKTDGIVRDFVETTTRDLENIHDQLDGNITSWFLSGVPTLSNEPAVNWTTDVMKDEHLGDLYYDNDEGSAYRFIKDEGVYKWNLLSDDMAARALAIANAAQDTADSKRRVFVVQPIPPYDVGDIWWNNDELYRCRIGRLEADTFNQNDWINSLKYTDDTVATEAVALLDDFKDEVAETYATSTDFYSTTSEIVGNVRETREMVANVNNDLVSYKNEVSSSFTQQANNFELQFNILNESVIEAKDIAESNSTKEYLRFAPGTGVEIGATNSDFKVNITNNEFNIQEKGAKVAYINNKRMYITESEVVERQYMGNFAFVINQDKSLSIRKVRDN